MAAYGPGRVAKTTVNETGMLSLRRKKERFWDS